MDSFRPDVSPDTQAFVAAILGKPDPAEVDAFARTLPGKPDPEEHATFLAAIRGEDSVTRRANFRDGAQAWERSTTDGSSDDRLLTMGVEEAKKAADEWKSTQTWNTGKNARILRKSMERDHVVFGPGEEPHHMVQSTDPEAAAAHALMDKYHIDINSAENGIKLTRQVHQSSGLQKKKAIRDFTARLRRAEKGGKSWNARRWRILEEFGRTRRDIRAGRFPCP
jgi:hypothetical protein